VDGSVNEGSISVSSIANIAESSIPTIFRFIVTSQRSHHRNILHGSANSIGGQTIVIQIAMGPACGKTSV